ncbi:MAG: UDP-glucose 4-epimerase GalE [Flavobacteriales bacterium]|nr:UDP-glucose 4-epimerase GalE [Flavobacteriales bacterium]MCC6937897.1 UDP-glucose 4-epimerase GalE [Flavobacteriales bacterium]
MKKVIVTGGAGFIGSHTVVELVAAGYEPVIVDDLRNSEERILNGIETIIGFRPTFHRLDCTDPIAVSSMLDEEGDVHGVIHFAADKAVGESMSRPAMYYRNNIGSLAVLLSLMRERSFKHIVFSSSCTVYGQPDSLPVSEDSPDRNASSPYGETKVVCEQLVRRQCEAVPGLKAALLRYFNPIGAHPSGLIGELPRGVPNNLVPFVTQTAAGLRDRLRVNGDDYDTVDGTCVRDYIHVVDLAQAHVTALAWLEQAEPQTCEAFNLGTGKGRTVMEVVNAFQKENKVIVPYVVGPRRAGDVVSVFADTTKSREVLRWEPQLTLEDAVRDAWRWQRALAVKA